VKEINQNDIVLVNLDPTKGSEMKKTRPCVVLSPNEMNRHLQTVVIAPLTTSSKSYPTRIEIKFRSTKGWIAIDQIRTIDRLRVVKRLGTLTEKEVQKVRSTIQETFVA
jgi:mRNA interferase MazF